MEIELSEDLQHYKESLVLGLTAKQFLFSALALGVGTGIVLLLYEKIGITLSCYVATPFVVPLALTGFYNYHGLTFWQFAGKMIYFSFFNRPLVYGSTESVQELKQIYMETRQEEEREVQQRKKDQQKEDLVRAVLREETDVFKGGKAGGHDDGGQPEAGKRRLKHSQKEQQRQQLHDLLHHRGDLGGGIDGVRLIQPGEEGVEIGGEQTGPHPRKAEHQRGAMSPL